MQTELELDHLFWNAITTNSAFFAWVIGRPKFAHRRLSLDTEELWHQRWYRDPETHEESETDITLFLSDEDTQEAFAIHIENKTSHRLWEKNQARNYRKRAANRMSIWKHADFQVALLAPQQHIVSHPAEAACFDFEMAYEAVGTFVPEFLAACT